jgi:hypothetical protein
VSNLPPGKTGSILLSTAGVVDTGGKFATSVNDSSGGRLPSVSMTLVN